MQTRLMFCIAALVVLAGCGGIPEVNTQTISKSPASSQQFAKAKQAVRNCSSYPDADAVLASFERQGLTPGQARMVLNDGTELVSDPSISHDDGNLIVSVSSRRCFVGLRGMTPQQSYELAQIWAKKFGSSTNAELGQGLSDHVVQAWRTRYADRTLYIAAHKTWPWDCLLYTSPSPRDQRGARMPSSA